MPGSHTERRILAVLAMVVVAVGTATWPKPAQAAPAQAVPAETARAAQAPESVHPCSVVQPSKVASTFPIPALNPAPVDPIATVASKRGGSFVNTVTDQPFVPRGAHYVRLATVRLSKRYTVCMSSDFDVGTGSDDYDPHRAAQALSLMHSYGYNEVSVGLNAAEVGNPSGTGLDPAYLANVASFINIARSYDIRVLISLDAPASERWVSSDQDLPTPPKPRSSTTTSTSTT